MKYDPTRKHFLAVLANYWAARRRLDDDPQADPAHAHLESNRPV